MVTWSSFWKHLGAKLQVRSTGVFGFQPRMVMGWLRAVKREVKFAVGGTRLKPVVCPLTRDSSPVISLVRAKSSSCWLLSYLKKRQFSSSQQDTTILKQIR